jgi:hypothetical protein
MPRRFSQKHGGSRQPSEIHIRDDAPQHIRAALLQIALDAGLSPSDLRDVVCRTLRVAPDRSNWSEYPNVWNEVSDLVSSCEWYHFYDIVEALCAYMTRRSSFGGAELALEVNQFFEETGVGWQLIDCELEVRGPEHFEAAVQSVATELRSGDRPTAEREFHEALLDLSRRPEPDVTGAVQHALAGLECVARDIVGDPKATLGEILKRYPDRIPRPLDAAVEKLWGFASERARHIREGGAAAYAEAELVVAVTAATASYISRVAKREES